MLPGFLKQLYKSHPEIERMKNLARSYVYWPKINFQIEQFVKKCSNCALITKAPVKVPLSNWSQPSASWQRVHVDYAGRGILLCSAGCFLKMAGDYSNANDLGSAYCQHFRSFGTLITLVSDNGTQFTSEKFQTFCFSNGIEHLRCPPFYSSSNSQAERFVDIFKRGLLKSQEEGKNFFQLFCSSTGSRLIQMCRTVSRRQKPCWEDWSGLRWIYWSLLPSHVWRKTAQARSTVQFETRCKTERFHSRNRGLRSNTC